MLSYKQTQRDNVSASCTIDARRFICVAGRLGFAGGLGAALKLSGPGMKHSLVQGDSSVTTMPRSKLSGAWYE